MKKYPYLLYLTNESSIHHKIIEHIDNAEVLHILAPFVQNFSSISHSNVFMYIFNEEQYYTCINNNWNYHIALYGNEIFESRLLQFLKHDTEIFWFPEHEQIQINPIIFSEQLKSLNLPICISYNPYLQKNIVAENFRLFVKAIHKNFINPLFDKELTLLDNFYSLEYTNNMIVIQQDNGILLNKAVLGLYGDYPILHDNYVFINKKSILKNKDCSDCDYTDLCIGRGLGYIMEELKYKGCISLKLMQPD